MGHSPLREIPFAVGIALHAEEGGKGTFEELPEA